MDRRADLHLHSTHSDGALSVPDLLRRVKAAGLSTVSLTDHDNVAGIEEAIAEGDRLGVAVIPGVEISANVGDREVHILGYFIDQRHGELEAYLKFCRTERVKRAERIVGKLNNLNIPLRLEAVLDLAGHGSVGRPHIAVAMLEEGLTGTYHEAFLKYIGFGKPAYEGKVQIAPAEAIALIASAGGLSFVAHPGVAMEERTLLALIEDGVDGIEAVHPSHSPELTAHYNGIAEEYFLLTSGGSDFHGVRRNDSDALGKYVITEHQVDAMRRRLR
jgi:predicted metal-dependent phosphoesterase TrpH